MALGTASLGPMMPANRHARKGLSDKPHPRSRSAGSRGLCASDYDRCMSSSLYLVHMANDIGYFFCARQPREVAIAGIANHMKSYWTHRMREKLIAQLEHGDDGLDELPREALR